MKSSLSKIVRNFLDDAKDSYTGPKVYPRRRKIDPSPSRLCRSKKTTAKKRKENYPPIYEKNLKSPLLYKTSSHAKAPGSILREVRNSLKKTYGEEEFDDQVKIVDHKIQGPKSARRSVSYNSNHNLSRRSLSPEPDFGGIDNYMTKAPPVSQQRFRPPRGAQGSGVLGKPRSPTPSFPSKGSGPLPSSRAAKPQNYSKKLKTLFSRTVNKMPKNLKKGVVRSHQEMMNITEDCKVEDFQFMELLGKGAYANTYRGVEKKSGAEVAVKIYNYGAMGQLRNSILSEIEVLGKTEHRSIVKLYKTYEQANRFILIMELCPTRCFTDMLRRRSGKRLAEDEGRNVFWQLADAVCYLHRRNIVHSDLKLENILYDERKSILKLIDFGFSVFNPKVNQPTFICGTPNYMCPEAANKIEHDLFKADIWALGVILYKLLTGIFPFRSKNQADLMKKIQSGTVTFPKSVILSTSMRDLIEWMLSPSQRDRPTIMQVLQHSWLTEEYEMSERCFSDIEDSNISDRDKR